MGGIQVRYVTVRLRVEHDQYHDKVLEGGRRDEAPHVITQTLVVLRYIHIHRLGIDHELDAGFLRRAERRNLMIVEQTGHA